MSLFEECRQPLPRIAAFPCPDQSIGRFLDRSFKISRTSAPKQPLGLGDCHRRRPQYRSQFGLYRVIKLVRRDNVMHQTDTERLQRWHRIMSGQEERSCMRLT